MFNILAIMAGGSIGAACRHGLFLVVQRFAGPVFPAGTLAVNLLGSFFIGFLWCLFDEVHWSHEWRLFVFTGLLGGFTTFSTFTRETFQLFKVGEWKSALVYLTLSNILGIVLVLCGVLLCKRLIFMLR
jgi:CrcB protein